MRSLVRIYCPISYGYRGMCGSYTIRDSNTTTARRTRRRYYIIHFIPYIHRAYNITYFLFVYAVDDDNVYRDAAAAADCLYAGIPAALLVNH